MSNGDKILWKAAIAKLTEELAKRFPDAYDPAHPEESDAKLLKDGKIAENDLLEVYNRAFGIVPLDENELDTPEVFADGYVRRSPVQPYLTAADYRSRMIRRAVGIALGLCAAVLLVVALLRAKLLRF